MTGIPAPRGFPAPGPNPQPESSTPGAAWFGTRDKGLVKLDGRGFSHIMVAPQFVQQIVPAMPDGLWVLAQYRLFLVRGEKVTPVESDPTWGPMERIAAGQKGEVWSVTAKKIGRFDGETWSYLDRSEIAPGKELLTIKDMDVDSFGRIYICSKSAIYIRVDGEWREVLLELAPKDVLGGLALFQDASAWIWTRQEVFHVGRTRWEPMYRQLVPPGLRRLNVSGDGAWFLEDGLVLLQGDLGKQPWPRLDLTQEPALAKRVRSSFVDSGSRVWMGTDTGVVILDRDGLLSFWPKGDVPLLDSEVRAIYVEGSGPGLPAVGH